MTLSLTNGDVVARYGDAPEGGLDAPQTSTFTSTSDRYPLSLQLRVEAASFDTWNRDSIFYFLASGAVLGLIFGMLLARLLTLPKSPLRELDDALAAGEFVPYMQPVFSLASGRIVGCEVLVRWHRPNGETVPPSRFIPLVEQSDRIARLTHDLMTRALRELLPLIDRDPEFSVAFNIAPGHFLADGFSELLEALVRTAGVRPSQIILELTERQELSDPVRAAALVVELRATGFQIAIDDAGTGHSGLSTVKSLGAQILKIDKLFVHLHPDRPLRQGHRRDAREGGPRTADDAGRRGHREARADGVAQGGRRRRWAGLPGVAGSSDRQVPDACRCSTACNGIINRAGCSATDLKVSARH